MDLGDVRVSLSCSLLMINHILCSQINGYREIRWNSRRKDGVFLEIGGLNFIDCVEQCLRRKRCLFINYSRIKLHCELNREDPEWSFYAGSVSIYYKNDLIEEDREYVYSHMSQWNVDLVGSCAHHDCNLNELCVVVEGTTKYVCKISECSSPPSFLNADLVLEPNMQIVFGIGSIKSYQLKEGYLSTSNDHDFQMTCHDGGNWIAFKSENNVQISQCDFLKQSSSIESVQLKTKFVRIPVVLEDSRKWMVIQRRCTGTVNFNRTMEEYKTGFGSLDTEFWIADSFKSTAWYNTMSWHFKSGNEAIHRLTFEGYHILHIELLADDIRYFGQYSSFNVDSEANGFQVQFNNFTGNISESLSYFNGMKFSAWDDDNDDTTANCALTNNGGWWFRSGHRVNVNGRYGDRSTKGLSWLMSEGNSIYPSRVIMMVQKP